MRAKRSSLFSDTTYPPALRALGLVGLTWMASTLVQALFFSLLGIETRAISVVMYSSGSFGLLLFLDFTCVEKLVGWEAPSVTLNESQWFGHVSHRER